MAPHAKESMTRKEEEEEEKKEINCLHRT